MGKWDSQMEALVIDAAFWRGRRVLITGHTGFKGGWLTLLLHHMGAEIAGLSDAVPTTPSLFEAARLGECLAADLRQDIRDFAALTAAADAFRPEIVFHLAAQPLVRFGYARPLETFAVNAIGAANCLEMVRRNPSVRSAIIVTSDKVYADQAWDFAYRESDRLGGADPYSASKACAELIAQAYRQGFGLDGSDGRQVVATVRAGNVVGGGDFSPDRLVPDLVRAIEAGTLPTLRHPTAIRPWQHVLDPLLGYLRLAELLFRGETRESGWNFGPAPASSVDVAQFVRRFAISWGTRLDPATSIAHQPRETQALRLDSTRAAVSLGWTPRLSFDAMLDLTTAWYRAFLNGDDMAPVSRRQAAVSLDGATSGQ
jgi:CDP-glucose 4,6-dehydratase